MAEVIEFFPNRRLAEVGPANHPYDHWEDFPAPKAIAKRNDRFRKLLVPEQDVFPSVGTMKFSDESFCEIINRLKELDYDRLGFGDAPVEELTEHQQQSARLLHSQGLVFDGRGGRFVWSIRQKLDRLHIFSVEEFFPFLNYLRSHHHGENKQNNGRN